MSQASSAASPAAAEGPSPGLVLLVVAAGGAAGALGRWAATTLFIEAGGFPWTTFTVNVVGSFLLAWLGLRPVVRRHPLWWPALGPGVLGGFTTLSAYSEQTRALLASGATGVATAYVAGTLLACLAAVAVAGRLAR